MKFNLKKNGNYETNKSNDMSKKLEILKQSLSKKERLLNKKISEHLADVRQANGQPLNDKRNVQSVLNRWERQTEGITSMQKSIEVTQNAIRKEENKIKNIEYVNTLIPDEIQQFVKSGELVQWKKFPHIFFVSGVEKARIIWDEKRKLVAHKFANEITDQEKRIKFVRLYNKLNSLLNNK